jgi:hypothetical protein
MVSEQVGIGEYSDAVRLRRELMQQFEPLNVEFSLAKTP